MFPWEIVIPAVIELIRTCIENNQNDPVAAEAAVREALRNPTRSQKALIEFKVLRAIPFRDRIGRRRELLDDFWSTCLDCTDAEISYLMSQA